ncbi:MAG: hypothetical protein F2806_08780 [Actinobacteria bacterium]|uniref:Unannotated protein n=1 Tax=freshwater metagenome TaxID=449393 RepID=A0A6J7HAT7_9ZZZZ|nr:hypothetical protein [Actinomycetota bacterium]
MTHIFPTQDDPLIEKNAELIGGPAGKYQRVSRSWWSPLRVIIVLTTMSYAIGVWLDSSCRNSSWISPQRYEHLCYTDIHPFYTLKGFAEGIFPYLGNATPDQMVDAPVLVGLFMQVAATITTFFSGIWPQEDAGILYYDITVMLLFIALLVTVIATLKTVKSRPWDAAMIALAPMMILAATISWDLLAIACVSLAFLNHRKGKLLTTGIFLGLALASAHYPIAIFIALIILALRSRDWNATLKISVTAVIVWLVINLPFAIMHFDGWIVIYKKILTSGSELGSVWYAITQIGGPSVNTTLLNFASLLLFAAAVIGILAITLQAPVPPRTASIVFLVVAAFALVAKGYSPQFGLWLIPLAVLARPRWRDFLIWQACQVVYFVAVWWFLAGYNVDGAKGLTPQWYAVATVIHIAGTLYFAYRVIQDINAPQHYDSFEVSPSQELHQSAR